MADTVVLVTAVADKKDVAGQGLLPADGQLQEKTYAAGKIPGGFFKREGRPSEKETLTSRLIDRPIRPLFPAGFLREVQVIATVLSLDTEIDPDIPALHRRLGRAVAVGLAVHGPDRRRARRLQGRPVPAEPDARELKESKLDLVVAGTQKRCSWSSRKPTGLSEDVMLGAVMFGHEQMQVAIKTINRNGRRCRQAEVGLEPNAASAEARRRASPRLRRRRSPTPTHSREAGSLRQDQRDQGCRDCWRCRAATPGSTRHRRRRDSLFKLESNIVRQRIIAGKPRIDGRDTKTVRKIKVKVGVLPRTHGSALFTRGETQALVVTTLGTGRDAQIIDALEGERREPFMLHYNFPPFSVGETGFIGSPKRREIGHGRLARRGVAAMMPDMETFPYVIRVVSEISSRTARARWPRSAAPALSLMDAGVPIKAPVAGVAMGLVLEGQALQGPDRHPRRRGSPRRHGLQGRRHARTASPPCRWTSRSTASRARS